MSIGGNKYGFVIVDGFTTYTCVFFLNDKSEVFNIFKSFVKRVENEFEMRVKIVKSDNGSEFKNTRFDELCDEMASNLNFWTNIPHNQIAMLRERI
jgi:hypothetical protein